MSIDAGCCQIAKLLNTQSSAIAKSFIKTVLWYNCRQKLADLIDTPRIERGCTDIVISMQQKTNITFYLYAPSIEKPGENSLNSIFCS